MLSILLQDEGTPRMMGYLQVQTFEGEFDNQWQQLSLDRAARQHRI
jgi:hypothetical protein